MGYIIKNKVEYGGVNKVVPNELVFDTYADYTTWRNSSAYDPETTCYIKGGGYAHASNIDYDNSESGLAATNVQGAISEISDGLQSIGVIENNISFPYTATYDGIAVMQVVDGATGEYYIIVDEDGSHVAECRGYNSYAGSRAYNIFFVRKGKTYTVTDVINNGKTTHNTNVMRIC